MVMHGQWLRLRWLPVVEFWLDNKEPLKTKSWTERFSRGFGRRWKKDDEGRRTTEEWRPRDEGYHGHGHGHQRLGVDFAREQLGKKMAFKPRVSKPWIGRPRFEILNMIKRSYVILCIYVDDTKVYQSKKSFLKCRFRGSNIHETT